MKSTYNGFSYDFEKEVYSSIKEIENFQLEQVLQLSKSNCTEKKICIIKKNENKILICKVFHNKVFTGLNEFKEEYFVDDNPLVLSNSSKKYVIHFNNINKANFRLTLPQTITLQLDTLHSGMMEDYDNKFHRLVIPIDRDVELYAIDCFSVKIQSQIIFNGLLQIRIVDKNYHFFKHDGKEKFIIIEGLQLDIFSNFQNDSAAILIAFGFITGNLIQNENYFQTSTDITFKKIENLYYTKKEQHIFTNSAVISREKFLDYIRSLKKESEYFHLAKTMSIEVFSNLCNVIKNNTTYARCCKLILEGNNAHHHLLTAGIFSIALETITTIIYEENKEKLNPVQDKTVAKNLRLELLSVLQNYSDQVPSETIKILQAKINNLNKPTNSKKLSYPFEIYGLKLNKKELEILNHRNKFLHGTTPFSENELEDNKFELVMITSHLKFMLNCLMLKYIGYSGSVINNPSLLEYNTKKELSDHLFKLI